MTIKLTLALAGVLDGKAIEMALAGDGTAVRLCLDRIIPPRRERPVRFKMPVLQSPADAVVAMAAIAACGGWLQNCCAAGRSDRRARAREPSSCQRTPPRVRPAPQSLARIAGTEPPGQRAQPMTRPLRLHARDYEVISRSRILSEQPTLSPALAATPPLVVPRPAPGSAARSADAAMSAPPRFGF